MSRRAVDWVSSFLLVCWAARGLAFFRIGIAVLGILKLILLAPNWLGLYGNEGYIEWMLTLKAFSHQWVPHLYHIAMPLKAIGIHEDVTVIGVGVLFGLLLLLSALGIWTRPAAALAWMIHLTLENTAVAFTYGFDGYIHAGLFYCISMPVARHWSLGRRNRRNPPSLIASGLSHRVLQLHLCIVYATAGISKMSTTGWWNGESMWMVISVAQYRQIDMTWMAQAPILAAVAGWGVLSCEALYPILVWIPKCRPYIVNAIIVFHVGIILFMGLHTFGAVMIVWNLAAWWPPDDLQRRKGVRNLLETGL